jgi:hypothetical protein
MELETSISLSGKVLESLLKKHQEILIPLVSPPFSSPHEATPLSIPGRLDVLLVIITCPVLPRLIVE